MIDYKQKVKQFISDFYTPGTINDFDFNINNNELLDKLHNVFPVDSIDDYVLTEVLDELHFKRSIVNDEYKWLFKNK